MKKFFAGLWILAILSGYFVDTALARTGYVSDRLILTFREGPGPSFSILKSLESDTPLTILEEKEGYYQVSLLTGETGWVDMRFIAFNTPKSVIIEQLTRQKAELETKLASLSQGTPLASDPDPNPVSDLDSKQASTLDPSQDLGPQLNAALENNRELENRLKESQDNYTRLEAQSQDVLQIAKKNRDLEAENKNLSLKITQMEQSSSHLFRTGMIYWFLAGVGVLLLGWIIGQSASASKRKNRSLLR